MKIEKRKEKTERGWTDIKLKDHFQFLIKQVEEEGIKARGQKEFILFLEGKVLTMKQQILAHCYQCSGYYDSMGAEKDCKNWACPMYFSMPYSSLKKRSDKPPRVMTQEHKDIMRNARELKRMQ
jgi:hypothetical protein